MDTINSNLDNFKNRLFNTRENILKITQKELADKLEMKDISEKEISWYENGLAFPTVEFLYNFQDKLKIKYYWLLTGKGDIY